MDSLEEYVINRSSCGIPRCEYVEHGVEIDCDECKKRMLAEHDAIVRADERVKMHKEMMAMREDNLVVIRKDGLDRLIAKAMEDAVERNEMYHRSKHTRPCCFCGKFHDIYENVPYFEAFGNRIYVCDECFDERIQSKDRFIQVEYMSAYHYGLDLPIYDENSNKIYERKEADKQ